MSNDTKTFRTVNGMRPTWANLGFVILFVAAASGWFVGYGRFSEKISNQDDNLERIMVRLRDVEKWQRDWPTKGELIMDRQQNERIDDLLRRIESIEQR